MEMDVENARGKVPLILYDNKRRGLSGKGRSSEGRIKGQNTKTRGAGLVKLSVKGT